MRLFGLISRRELGHINKVEAAYQCYRPEIVSTFFPGGKKQASIIITSLGTIFGLNLSTCDAKQYFELLKIYTDVMIRRIMTQSTDSQIITSLQSEHDSYVKNKAIAQKIIAYVTLCMKDNTFVLNKEEDLSELDFIIGLNSHIEQTASKNWRAEKENLDDPEYGIVVNKPIYTEGVVGSNRYLAELRTTQGENLSWKRLGSTSVEGINGMIDIYEGRLPSGKIYKTLYLNMYGSTNSNSIPKGFIKESLGGL